MVLAALVLALFIVNIYVIPVFGSMFAKLGGDLPLTTRILIGTSDLFVNYWWLLSGAIVVLVFAWLQFVASQSGRYLVDRYQLRMPLIGSILEQAVLARFARSFAMMLAAGVPVTNALSLVADAVDNVYLAAKIQGMRESIERGDSLLRAANRSDMFTPLVLQMIAVGEETGQIEDLLSEVASYYEREVDFDLKNLTAKIEPLLIALVAAMVGVLALGIFTPMWQMMGEIR